MTFADSQDLLRWRQRFEVVEIPSLSPNALPSVPQRVIRPELVGLPELVERP